MNFFRLCKILTDNNGCIEWCKEHNLLASSVKELGAVKHSAGLYDLHRETGTSGDARRGVAMEWHQYARTHGFLVASFPLKNISPNLRLGAQIFRFTSSA